MEDNYYLHDLSEEDKNERLKRLATRIVEAVNYINEHQKRKGI